MINRRKFIKTAFASALLLQFPLMISAEEERSFLYEHFGNLPDPGAIQKVLSAGPVADVLLMSLVPNKLMGLSSLTLTDDQKSFLPENIANLPKTGRFAGRGTTASLENIIQLKPDIIIDIGTVSPAYISTAERFYQQTNIPYILANGTFSQTAVQIRTLGDIVGVKDHAALLSTYAENILQVTHNIVAKNREGRALKVYSARSADGLETGLSGSIHTEVLDWVGAENAAKDAGEKIMTRVSMEQLMLWQPDVILINDAHFYQTIAKDPRWARIKAVKDNRFYKVPNLPFGWIDQPPSVNRLLGASWLSYILAPEQYSKDAYIRAVIEYYALFYQHYLSEEALISLVKGN